MIASVPLFLWMRVYLCSSIFLIFSLLLWFMCLFLSINIYLLWYVSQNPYSCGLTFEKFHNFYQQPITLDAFIQSFSTVYTDLVQHFWVHKQPKLADERGTRSPSKFSQSKRKNGLLLLVSHLCLRKKVFVSNLIYLQLWNQNSDQNLLVFWIHMYLILSV